MDDDLLIASAMREYQRRPLLRSREDGVGVHSFHWEVLTLTVPVGDPDHGKVVKGKGGRKFVIVEDEDGSPLAMYLVRSGRLRRLSRWPSVK